MHTVKEKAHGAGTDWTDLSGDQIDNEQVSLSVQSFTPGPTGESSDSASAAFRAGAENQLLAHALAVAPHWHLKAGMPSAQAARVPPVVCVHI